MNTPFILSSILCILIVFGCGGAGESEELTTVPSTYRSDQSIPLTSVQEEVTAAAVVDRASLKAFVQASKAFYQEAIRTTSHEMVGQLLRANDSPWKSDEIYVFIGTLEGVMLMHGEDSTLDGKDISSLRDSNGVMITQELIAAAVQGGGFIEYLFDNPAVDGDEESGSPKVGYAELMDGTGLDGDSPVVIGSGYYRR